MSSRSVYLIYKREPQASGCKSDTDRMRIRFPEKIELEAYVNQDKISIRFTDID
jgi:hypothetical protein